MEQFVDVQERAVSKETEFIVNEGINRGFCIAITKITNCLFLSAQAKMLYTLIKHEAGANRDVVVSYESLQMQLRWSLSTLMHHINELIDAELVMDRTESKQVDNKRLHLLPLHESKTLRHSEIIYEIVLHCEARHGDVASLMHEYEGSGLYELARRSPERHVKDIAEWFGYYLGQLT
ncbi:hypothetical protein NQ117_09485 [Paenibacillus sp. SC116]|uniref:hypothetical protein n=1 Tax=Paenibacillus sp. SC116 TaxID=2968986 RepID=UPI00215B29EF|nr:hypothetical protein [Paenibacillus sp. SC116]MCR8843919.1 hypothetical protein [Paenibacillus sp. SC116]